MQIDRSARSTVVICTLPGCGARDLVAPDAENPWIREHMERAHPPRQADALERSAVLAALSERERNQRRKGTT